jgi:hypothetical protein
VFLEGRRAVVGVVASQCELSRFLGSGGKRNLFELRVRWTF